MATVTKTRTYSAGDTLTGDNYNDDRDEIIAGVNSVVNAQIATNAAIATSKINATFPSGTIVGTTDTQTLTNKTLTAPVISSISNTGTVTLPTSTDTLVGRATTDTLTNKTLTSPTMTTPTLGVASATALNTTVAASGNDVPLEVTQNDTTNNPVAASIVNAGTGNGLTIDQNGNGTALVIDSEATTQKALTVSAAVNDGQELVRFTSDAAGANAWAFFAVKKIDALDIDICFCLGAYHIWVDATGDLRIKDGVPTSDTDGTVVGAQS